jgi:diguanylate cyclase (GGDEF)-like protein
VIVAYLLIFRIWRRCYLAEEPRDRNRQLMTLAYIFLWCAVCGYVLSIVMFFWPAYRFLAICLVALNVVSWRFALNSREFQQSFTAKRLERQLKAALVDRNEELQKEVKQRTADLTESARRFRELASHDTLTGMLNRAGMHDAIEQALLLRRAGAMSGELGVLLIDFDRFKNINDTLGHSAGDQFLVEIARRLEAFCADPVGEMRWRCARFGGDEFVLLAAGVDSLLDLQHAARDLLGILSAPVSLDGLKVQTSASIGITWTGLTEASVTALLRDSDLAMYRAKNDGRAAFRVFDIAMQDKLQQRLRIESALREAVEQNQIGVAYQPIVCLESGRLLGFEALARWTDEQLGVVSPGEFIPVAEESGLIAQLTDQVTQKALTQLERWHDLIGPGAELSMNINLSPALLERTGVVGRVARAIGGLSIEPRHVCFEVTESAIMRDVQAGVDVLARLRSTGVRLAMDDFGTGYSSLACLHEFPLDVLKIDRAFIANMSGRRDYAAIVLAITTLAHNLGLKVTAEGVETAEQIAQLQALECDAAQGYHLARPMPADAAETYLMAHLHTLRAA